DQGLLQAERIRDRADERGDRLQAGPAGRPPAPLAGNQLVAVVAQGPDQDRLQDAQLPDRRGEAAEAVLVEARPRLMGVGGDAPDGYLEEGRGAIARHLGGDEGPE